MLARNDSARGRAWKRHRTERDSQNKRGEPWGRVDELNWAADRAPIRIIKKRGEEPSEWLANEYRELSARRKAVVSRG